MSGSLARYHARSPRYVLDAHDNNLIRYSGPERAPWEEKTELKNISLTGLSFIASQDLRPQLGEIIRIQFEVPGSEPMACHALVIRIENINSTECEVAIHFYKLDRIQRINLVEGLSLKHSYNKTSSSSPKSPTKWKPYIVVAGLFISALAWITFLKFFFL